MIDKNQGNDEYEFSDPDLLTPDSMDEHEAAAFSPNPAIPVRKVNQIDIRRNAIIVIVLIVVGLLLYKFIGVFLSKKPAAPVIVTTPKPAVQPVKAPVYQSPPTRVVQTSPPEIPALKAKLEAMDINQQNIRNDVNTANNQLNGINSNINDLNAKIASLSEMVANLSNVVQQQSNQITVMMTKQVERKKPRIKHYRPMITPQVYFIQAVIPGRAWLLAQNGSTITVREGSKVEGYGLIQRIDAMQGRVITSSGRVIKFSQRDN